jgi:hypothetical protein
MRPHAAGRFGLISTPVIDSPEGGAPAKILPRSVIASHHLNSGTKLSFHATAKAQQLAIRSTAVSS